MREILFRGKRVSDGEWVTGYYIKAEHHWHKYGIHKDWIACSASANGGWFALHNKYAVITATVGQYTGLTDKNGKKIFEGDIVRTEYSRMYHVSFNEGRGGWYPFACGDGCGCCEDETEAHEYVEVIGNITDNPELLKGDNDADLR